jgi:uncharacterized protein (DUF433 family)
MATATSWVTKTPGVCGGDACIRTTRHTVHGLVEWKRLGVSDEKLLTMFAPPLTPADLDAAWRYAADHPQEIERALWRDRVATVEHGPGIPPPLELIAEGHRLGLSDDEIRETFLPPLAADEWLAISTAGAA